MAARGRPRRADAPAADRSTESVPCPLTKQQRASPPSPRFSVSRRAPPLAGWRRGAVGGRLSPGQSPEPSACQGAWSPELAGAAGAAEVAHSSPTCSARITRASASSGRASPAAWAAAPAEMDSDADATAALPAQGGASLRIPPPPADSRRGLRALHRGLRPAPAPLPGSPRAAERQDADPEADGALCCWDSRAAECTAESGGLPLRPAASPEAHGSPLQAALRAAQSRVAELEEELRRRAAETAAARAEAEAAERSMRLSADAARGDAQRAAAQRAAIEAQLNAARAGCLAAQAQRASGLAELHDRMRRAAEAHAESLAAAWRGGQAKRDEARRLRGELRAACSDHFERTQRLQAEAGRLRAEAAQLRSSLDVQQAELARCLQRAGGLDDELRAARGELAAVRQDLTAARDDLADERERSTILEWTLEAERDRGARAREELSRLKADIADFAELGRPLGAGGFGEAIAAEIPLVVKRTHPGGEEALRREAAVLSRLRRADPAGTARVVRIFGAGCFGPPLDGMLLERARGDLCDLRPRHPRDVLECARDLLQGLRFLEENGVVHRDIKESNLLVDKDGCVVIADFGLYERTGDLAEGGWTPGWQPPEALLVGGLRDTQPAEDWWAAALVIAALVFNEHPLRSVVTPERDDLEEARHHLRRSEEFAGETFAEAAPHFIQQADFFDGQGNVLDPERRSPLQGIGAGRWLTGVQWCELLDGAWDGAQRLPPVCQPWDIPHPSLRRVVMGMARLDAGHRWSPRRALAELE
eukprot:TRINITY_DN18289_c0_g5_i2.p1 TRINITY_DN18289_c0_g5~~TRINITY_DN18289_c0_g5_i2.p1  ORF type:complete len:793 (+),score=199.91 TRINITY_DN18289_c0_g5_i2:80-2380(+)